MFKTFETFLMSGKIFNKLQKGLIYLYYFKNNEI